MDEDKILRVKWSKKENDHMIHYPRRCDGHLMSGYFFYKRYNYDGKEEKSIAEELEERGYDLKTMKFEIKLKE